MNIKFKLFEDKNMPTPYNKPPEPQEVLCIACGEKIFKTIFLNDLVCEECKKS